MAAIALALSSSLAWGVADFVGGVQSRRLPVLTVLLVAASTGLVIAATVVAVRGEAPPAGSFAVYAVVSGIAGAVALAAFYRGLAFGAMSIVAPVSATGAAIPVVFGLAAGERPSAAQVVGVVLALVGVVLASREGVAEDEGGDGASAAPAAGVARGVPLALLAALGFGVFLAGMGRASEDDALWAILVNRATSVSALLLAALALRPPLPPDRRTTGTLAAVGTLDICANTLYAVATTLGLLSIVGVLGSLYPVTTILLARLLLRERIERVQEVGVAGALAGVALIAAG